MIDFHTHIFPDTMAGKTVGYLAGIGGVTSLGTGTATDLLLKMKAAGISRSVNLPVATKPSQFASINRFAASLNAAGGAITSFGAIHPDDEEPEAELDELVSLGFRGIKLHPDYQLTMIDDPRYLRILRGALARNLHVSIHAGADEAYPEPVHCPPEASLRVLGILKSEIAASRGKIILAHLGGNRQWDGAERLLVGCEAYLDLSFVVHRVPREQLFRMIRGHGAARILFGSDYPWSNPADDVAYLSGLPLTDREKQQIFTSNAEELLGLSS